MPKKSSLPHYRIQHTDEGLQIIIPGKKSYFSIIWIVLWLVMLGYMISMLSLYSFVFVKSAFTEPYIYRWIMSCFSLLLLLFALKLGQFGFSKFF